MPQRGLVEVYTGGGKGKTTAALGLALRALGHDRRVAFFQFLKGGGKTGEAEMAARLSPQLRFDQYGTGEFIIGRPPSPAEIAQAREGLTAAAAALASGRYDLVILDEIAAAVNLGLLDVEAVAAAVGERFPKTEAVLTGQDMPSRLLELADLISEITAVRHPHAKGVTAREGIEY